MGNEKWMQSEAQNSKANQYTYRKAIFALCTARKLGGHDKIQWGHQLVDLKKSRAKLLNLALK
jgi:hypothetical protein